MSQIALDYLDTIEIQQKEIEELKAQLEKVNEPMLCTTPILPISADDFINRLSVGLNDITPDREVPWVTLVKYTEQNNLSVDIFELYDLEDRALEMCKALSIIPRVITRMDPYIHTIYTFPELILKQLFWKSNQEIERLPNQGLGLCSEVMLVEVE